MVSFKLLDHPSDIGIEAVGPSLSEVFMSAASGLISLMVDPETIRSTESRQIEITAGDNETLLVKWLNELIFLFDARHFIVKDMLTVQLENRRLTAVVRGETFSVDRHVPRTDVKAATFHQLYIGELDGVWTARVFVDI